MVILCMYASFCNKYTLSTFFFAIFFQFVSLIPFLLCTCTCLLMYFFVLLLSFFFFLFFSLLFFCFVTCVCENDIYIYYN